MRKEVKFSEVKQDKVFYIPDAFFDHFVKIDQTHGGLTFPPDTIVEIEDEDTSS